MAGHVNRTLFGVLLMLLCLSVGVERGGLMVILVGFYLMATGIFRLARYTTRALFRVCSMLFGALLPLLALGVHVVNGGRPAWEFTVMVSVMVAYMAAKGTLQLNRDSEPFGMILVILGLGLYIVIMGMERGVVQVYYERKSASLLNSASLLHNIRQYLKVWKERMRRYGS
ncbi:uncharacterized protein LOC124621809 [Schistocerca americana]|uniref:uncharacterized protein LOC124621809 n=1 Tax=Schistocerca americana TaxID=7009 RepID=UPI001F4F4CBE|nr:uncharacterized protein LOC124621809 [Schistocerca americana]